MFDREHEVRLSAWLDGELPAEEAERVTRHLDSCAECRALVASFRTLGERLARETEPDPGFVVRFRARRDELSVAPWWTWRQLAFGLIPVAAAALVGALLVIWASPAGAPDLRQLELEALGNPQALSEASQNPRESVLSIALGPFPEGPP